MGKAYSTAWFVGVFIPLIVMIGLYSRVIYALWFKGNDGNQLTQQQKVSLILLREFTYASQRKSPLPPTKISSLRKTKIPWPVNKKLYLAIIRGKFFLSELVSHCSPSCVKPRQKIMYCFRIGTSPGGEQKIPSHLYETGSWYLILFQNGRQVSTSCLCGSPHSWFFSYLNTQLTARSSVYLTIKIKVALLIRFYITISIGFGSSKYMPS